MIKVNGYETYPGGKGGAGTYQTIINRIPPHRWYYSLFLGNCGVTRHIKPAECSFLNDLDVEVIETWAASIAEAAILDRYLFYNIDAVEMIKNLISADADREDVFIYADPPYLKHTRKSQADIYRYEMTDMEHNIFLAAVTELKAARVMISHYPNDLYDEALKGWYTHDFMSKTRNGMAKERLYMNYEPTNKLHDYSFIGGNFREREKLNRMKNNLFDKLGRVDPVLRNSILADIASHKW